MQIDKTIRLPYIPQWLVWIVAVYFVGFGLGGYAVLDNNEGLYAEISREMLRSGDWTQWIIPHLNGLSYMEKPPLLYWLTAFSFAVFGEAEWVVRLVPALSCLGCVGLILWFSKKLNRESGGRFAAIVFVSGLGVTAMSRTLMFDMLLTVFLTGAVMNGYLYLDTKRRSFLYRSMAMLALALLAKGFVSLILFFAITGGYILCSSSSVSDFFKRLAMWLDWRGIAVFFVISAPWHIAAILTEPIFAWFYFINEHILIFLSVWQCGWTGAELLCSLLYRLHGISLPSLLSLLVLGFTLSMSIYCVSWGSASLMIIMLVHGGTTFRASSCFYFLGLCCCPLYFFQKRKN